MTQTESAAQKKTQGSVVSFSMPRKPRGPPHGVNVFQNGFDDHAEGQRDDCQIIAACLKGGNRHQKADEGCTNAARQYRQREKDADCTRWKNVNCQKRGDIGAYGHESGMSHGKFAHVAIDQIQTDGEDDVDAHINQNQLQV